MRDSAPRVGLDENVFGLEVGVDEAQRVQEGEGVQDLARDLLHARQGEVRRVTLIPVVLLELVQVGAQQLAHQEQVLLGSIPTTTPQAYTPPFFHPLTRKFGRALNTMTLQSVEKPPRIPRDTSEQSAQSTKYVLVDLDLSLGHQVQVTTVSMKA